MKRISTQAIVLLAALAACGGDDSKKPAKTPGDSQADPVKAQKILYAGEEAMKKGDYERARKLYNDAERYADTHVRDQIRTAREVTDEEQSKGFASDIVNRAESDECHKAIDETMLVIKMSDGLAKFIRLQTDEAHHDCLVRMLKADKLAAARAILTSEVAEKVLLPKTFKKLGERVEKLAHKAVDDAVKAPLEAKEWQQALDVVDGLVKEGKAGAADKTGVQEKVREGITAQVSGLHREALGDKKKGDDELKQIDSLLVLGWGDAPPPGLRRKRLELAFWLVCRGLKCDADAVSKRWTYGHVSPTPLLEPKGKAAAEQIKSGTLVWEIATSSGWSLVAAEDPGKLDGIGARPHVATGWVPGGSLKSEDTSEWLPPGPSLVGTRVWGPLRKGQKTYELGRVAKLKGTTATVQRLTDRAEIEVPVSQLRFGLTKKGLKVLGYCSQLTKLEPVLIDSVKETKYEQQGDPLVTVQCLDPKGKPTGQTKEGQLYSIRIEPGWLPPRR